MYKLNARSSDQLLQLARLDPDESAKSRKTVTYISLTMSRPPTNSPLTMSCGNVGHSDLTFMSARLSDWHERDRRTLPDALVLQDVEGRELKLEVAQDADGGLAEAAARHVRVALHEEHDLRLVHDLVASPVELIGRLIRWRRLLRPLGRLGRGGRRGGSINARRWRGRGRRRGSLRGRALRRRWRISLSIAARDAPGFGAMCLLIALDRATACAPSI